MKNRIKFILIVLLAWAAWTYVGSVIAIDHEHFVTGCKLEAAFFLFVIGAFLIASYKSESM